MIQSLLRKGGLLMVAEPTTRTSTIEEARIAAKADQHVLDDGGYVLTKTGQGYGYRSAPNPAMIAESDLGNAFTGEIVERAAWKNGDWTKVGKITTEGNLARELVPETEHSSTPP